MIQVLNRAFDIIELLAVKPDKELTLKEIADNLELNHGTCANILKTMINRQYVVQTERRKGYKLGPIFEQLTGLKRNFRELIDLCMDPMRKLSAVLNEGVILSVLNGDKRMIIHEVRSKHELQVINKKEKPAYRTSTGRLLLAYLDENELEDFITKFGLPDPDIWPQVEDIEDLFIEFERIRKKELAIQTAVSHVTGIAAPIYRDDKVVASLGLYLPEVRFIGDMKEMSIEKLKETSNKINSVLREKNEHQHIDR